jgi:hypothetical protein
LRLDNVAKLGHSYETVCELIVWSHATR